MDELILVWFNKSELYLFPVLISLIMYNGYLNRFELIFQAPSFGNHRENISSIYQIRSRESPLDLLKISEEFTMKLP